MKTIEDLKVAIVCDSLDQYGGAEKIVDVIHEIFPQAPIYTSFYDREKMLKHGFDETNKEIILPPFGRNKFLMKFAKHLFFIYPLIFESFDFSKYDLVISSSSRFAHGIITPIQTVHLCYMHSPSRYAWDYFVYKEGLHLNKLFSAIYSGIISYLRVWDREAADRVDGFIANSKYTKLRIRKFYKRDSFVINPYVDTKRFVNADNTDGGYYLYLGRMIPWRKLDVVIEAFNNNGLSLRLVGNGDSSYIQSLMKKAHANITFHERQSDDEVVNHLLHAKALIWPSIEDFGMAPVEAQAAGKPVIALRKGGTLDTVIDGKTGLFFDETTAPALQQAIKQFQSMKFDEKECMDNSQRFKKEKFIKELKEYINGIFNESSISS